VQIKFLAAIAVLAVSTVYIGSKIFLPPQNAIDFKYFWLAGDLWRDGIIPYAPIFLERGQEVFAGGSVPQQWAYPPHFRPFAEVMAQGPFEVSAYIWRAFNVAFVAGGVLLVVAGMRETLRLEGYVIALAIAVAFTMSGTAISVAIGQSATLIFVAYCAFVFGYLTDRRAIMILALVVLMIKPTYGIIPAFFLLAHWRYFSTLFIAGSVTVALSVWGLWGADLPAVVKYVAAALEKYATAPVNGAADMTGIRHLIYLTPVGETSQFIYALLGACLAFALGWFVDRGGIVGLNRMRGVSFLCLVMLVFAPMHTYDSYTALALVLPALALSRVEMISSLGLLLVFWRSNNVAEISGLRLPETLYFTGSTLESLASGAVFLILIGYLIYTNRARVAVR
jgi:hypothetical protein